MVPDSTGFINIKIKIMKKGIITLVSVLLIVSSSCTGQVVQYPADSQPASSNVRGAEYPRITTDLKVIFRIKAPEAQKMQIKLDKIYDMVKDDHGFWTITTDPQVAGFHYYFLLIDGVQVSDPASESPGADHEWLTWRRDLYDFAPRLFK